MKRLSLLLLSSYAACASSPSMHTRGGVSQTQRFFNTQKILNEFNTCIEGIWGLEHTANETLAFFDALNAIQGKERKSTQPLTLEALNIQVDQYHAFFRETLPGFEDYLDFSDKRLERAIILSHYDPSLPLSFFPEGQEESLRELAALFNKIEEAKEKERCEELDGLKRRTSSSEERQLVLVLNGNGGRDVRYTPKHEFYSRLKGMWGQFCDTGKQNPWIKPLDVFYLEGGKKALSPLMLSLGWKEGTLALMQQKYNPSKTKVPLYILDSGMDPKNVFMGQNVEMKTLPPSENYDAHGTYVAGTVAQIYPKAPIEFYDIGDGQGNLKDSGWLLKKIKGDWAEDFKTPGVVNMSFGENARFIVDSEKFEYIKHLVEKGHIVVMSAGNESFDFNNEFHKTYIGQWNKFLKNLTPEGKKRIIMAGAAEIHGGNNQKAEFSNEHKTKDELSARFVFAPGETIATTGAHQDIAHVSGTSFSAPAICAIIARLVNDFGCTLDKAADLVQEHTDTKNGYRYVNFHKILQSLENGNGVKMPEEKGFFGKKEYDSNPHISISQKLEEWARAYTQTGKAPMPTWKTEELQALRDLGVSGINFSGNKEALAAFINYLSQTNQLESLFLGGTHIEELEDLGQNKKSLKVLELGGNSLVKFSGEGYDQLFRLNLNGNKNIKDIRALAKLPKLIQLGLKDTAIEDWSPIEQMESLKTLWFGTRDKKNSENNDWEKILPQLKSTSLKLLAPYTPEEKWVDSEVEIDRGKLPFVNTVSLNVTFLKIVEKKSENPKKRLLNQYVNKALQELGEKRNADMWNTLIEETKEQKTSWKEATAGLTQVYLNNVDFRNLYDGEGKNCLLEGLPIWRLTIKNSEIEKKDYKTIEKLPLQELNLEHNTTNIEGQSLPKTLDEINLRGQEIKDLSWLENQKALWGLDLRDTGYTNWTQLKKVAPNLQELSVGGYEEHNAEALFNTIDDAAFEKLEWLRIEVQHGASMPDFLKSSRKTEYERVVDIFAKRTGGFDPDEMHNAGQWIRSQSKK